ncbi:hypothetical protein ACLM45_00830 [Synechococcus sp. A10-1-5-9]|uniref:hypothetical protein n=1 Tax=Synechococcus sp. A10-1-5-9 TaxID=3392295 RepID=UPI0039ECCA82
MLTIDALKTAVMEPITWLVITWATYGAHRTTAALEKIPQASMEQCSENAKRIIEWQPKASAKCIEGVRGI